MNQSNAIIGKWTCPAGNNRVDAVLEGDGPGVNFYWDSRPLTPRRPGVLPEGDSPSSY
jgi:hypothetical protein